jgi:uncharacterized membrane protein YhiD involved in acid resistance
LAGLGFWYEASIGIFFVIVYHLILRSVENSIEKRTFSNTNNRYQLLIKCGIDIKDAVRINLFQIVEKHNNLRIKTYRVDFTS